MSCRSSPWPSFSYSSSSMSSQSLSIGTQYVQPECGRRRCTTAPLETHWQSAAPREIVPCQLQLSAQLRHGGTGHISPYVAIAHANKPVNSSPCSSKSRCHRASTPAADLICSCAHTHPSVRPLWQSHSSARPPRCRKHSCEKHANLESRDTQEAARSDWDHEGS
jgi:hypothetical protein